MINKKLAWEKPVVHILGALPTALGHCVGGSTPTGQGAATLGTCENGQNTGNCLHCADGADTFIIGCSAGGGTVGTGVGQTCGNGGRKGPTD